MRVNIPIDIADVCLDAFMGYTVDEANRVLDLQEGDVMVGQFIGCGLVFRFRDEFVLTEVGKTLYMKMLLQELTRN